MKNYLFVLGRNFELSRAELVPFCEEVFSDREKGLFIAKNLRFENPRELPKTPEQIFLDRMGGVIRFGEVLGEFFSKKELLDTMLNLLKKEEKNKIGFSVIGAGKKLFPEIFQGIRDYAREKDTKIRIENSKGENMTSGQIFDRKLLQKGMEFIIWKRGNSFLLARTVANQNLRNYTLRDRRKVFRDSKMGMLPPKLGQIMINLANPSFEETVIDPFCGSGTVNIEAAVTGYKTIGSDINPEFVEGAIKNFEQMAQKFRYEVEGGVFETKDAKKIDWKDQSGVICTEGFLGENFDSNHRVTPREIANEERKVLDIWIKIFENLGVSQIRKVVFCLPCWNFRGKKHSIAEKLFAKIPKNFYIPQALFARQKTFIYERDKTFVGREICVMERK
ncbi:DNA adenine methylase [Candidatus Gracilibacteria bacterium]|nr:DNA adenine methylase [Candidatus Gracilibacteria bacterium]